MVLRNTKIISMSVNVLNLAQAVAAIVDLTSRNNGAYVCVSNVHMCMEVYDSPEFAQVVNQADLVLPDGRPLYWAQRLLGETSGAQVRGQDILTAICEESAKTDLRVGFYGGSSDIVITNILTKLKDEHPNIKIVYSFSPPFRPLSAEEDKEVIETIVEARVDVLFVGIGCPKQERWMAEHVNSLGCVMVGVGAAFDFISGEKKHAPQWLQKLGLEWMYRLFNEPRRLWRRYLKQNPRFIFYFIKQLVKLQFVNK